MRSGASAEPWAARTGTNAAAWEASERCASGCRWAGGQGDHTHFTGEGYNELAAALFSDIVHEYNSMEACGWRGRCRE